MRLLSVVGVGLDGLAGLAPVARAVIGQAALLAGSPRLLALFPDHPAPRLEIQDWNRELAHLANLLTTHPGPVVLLATGDPLFFGAGRLVLTHFPPEAVTFYPALSALQLAFSRLKQPWQDACLLSAHGRSLETLNQALQQRHPKIAVLTDPQVHTPVAIAHLLKALDLSDAYALWVCEDLGSATERVRCWTPAELTQAELSPLNLVVLLARPAGVAPVTDLPILGIPDACFLSFPDKPGLLTKREVRLLVLGELNLRPNQVIWDIGAGTGSVAIEAGRLVPSSRVFAIERTALGQRLIQQNCQRLGGDPVTLVSGEAPAALAALPDPDRVFIGGSGGHLGALLTTIQQRLRPGGVVVIALATLEHQAHVQAWAEAQAWPHRWLQVNLCRSAGVGPLTRWLPLNPVTVFRAQYPVGSEREPEPQE